MKKLLKIPVLLIVLMLIVTSCGRNAEEDAKTVSKMTNMYEQKKKAKQAEGTKRIKLYKKLAVNMQSVIDVMQYYSENEDAYDDFIVEVEYVNPKLAKQMGEYEDFKREVKTEINRMKEDLEDWNKEY